LKYDDGTIRALYGDAVPQREEDGSVLGTVSLQTSPERKRAEEVLRESEEMFSELTSKIHSNVNFHA